jgi:hypothetical protein
MLIRLTLVRNLCLNVMLFTKINYVIYFVLGVCVYLYLDIDIDIDI